jgi:hypothetical protein
VDTKSKHGNFAWIRLIYFEELSLPVEYGEFFNFSGWSRRAEEGYS